MTEHQEKESNQNKIAGLLEDGDQYIKPLKFEKRLKPCPDGIGYKGWDLVQDLLSPGEFGAEAKPGYGAEAKREVAEFVDFVRSRNILAKLTPEEREDFIFSATYYYYLTDGFGMGDTLMSSLHLSEEQQRSLSKLMLMEAMTAHHEAEGTYMYTARNIVHRVLKFYPELADNPEVRSQAKKAFVTEINALDSFRKDIFTAPNDYIEMGLVSVADVDGGDPQLVNAIESKAREALQKGELKIAAVLRSRYIAEDSEFWNSDEVRAAAENGFRDKLTDYPDSAVAKRIVEAFLPDGFLDDDQIKEFIVEKYKESLSKGQFSSIVEFISEFGDQIPEELKDQRIWESELDDSIRKGFIEGLGRGWRGILDFKNIFTLPEDLQAENLRDEIVQGLSYHLRFSSTVDYISRVFECFQLSPEIWQEVISTDLLMKFYKGEKYHNRRWFLEGITKLKELGLEPRANSRTLQEFTRALQEEEPVFNSDSLIKILPIAEAQPDLLPLLNMQAGDNFPQGATLERLIKYCNKSSLRAGAIEGLYMFTIDEVEEITQNLDRDLPEGLTSYHSVPFFNILKQDFFKRMDGDQKEQLLGWIRKWRSEAREALQKGNSRKNILLAKPHWTRFRRRSKESAAEVVNSLLGYKAVAFAKALAIMNNPGKIADVGKFIDHKDPNKLYLVSRKKLYHMLKGHFKEIQFPPFQ